MGDDRLREELVVLNVAMTRQEYVGMCKLMSRRGEVSLAELLRSLLLQAMLEESVEEVRRRRKMASSGRQVQGTHDDDERIDNILKRL